MIRTASTPRVVILWFFLSLLPVPAFAEFTDIRQAREQIGELESENQQLHQKLQQLERQILELQQQIEEHVLPADVETGSDPLQQD